MQDGESATHPSQWYANGAGRTARLTFTLAVAAYLKPEFTEMVSPQQYWVGTMVEPLTYTLMPRLGRTWARSAVGRWE